MRAKVVEYRKEHRKAAKVVEYRKEHRKGAGCSGSAKGAAEYLYQVFKDSDLDGIFIPGGMPDAERLTLEEAMRPVVCVHEHLKNDVERAQTIPEAARRSKVLAKLPEYQKALGFYTIGKQWWEVGRWVGW
jgi:hypothetical protein